MRTRFLLPSLWLLAMPWFATVAPLVTVRADETPDVAPPAPNVAVDEPAVRRAIERSLPLLTKAAVGHRENRTCFACHNQGLAIMALTAARERGFSIDEEELKRQLAHTAKFLERNRDQYREGKGQGGQVDMAGYALLALQAGRWQPDDTTTAVVEYLLRRDQDRDHYVNVSVRPPSEASPLTTTYVGLRGLADFGRPEHRERIDARRTTVLGWLKQVEPKDHEDRVFRLFALHAAGAPAEILATARQTLLDKQRPDGGWGQLDTGEPVSALESDAYATGTALVALHQAGGLDAKHAAYQRGLAYLLKTQLDDASWKVASRSKPFQTYFESGYPHGKDQFISCAAGGWATLALLQATPKAISRRPMRGAATRGEDRKQRIDEALRQHEKLSRRRDRRQRGDGDKTRVSTTAPEARVVKTANGGVDPVFNVQFVTDATTRIVVAVDVSNHGADGGELPPMRDQLRQDHGKTPRRVLVDSAFATKESVTSAERGGSIVNSSIPPSGSLAEERPGSARGAERGPRGVLAIPRTHGGTGES